MSSYIYSNYLGMYSKGYDGYNIFLNQFPDDELIESVMYELEQLKSKESDKMKHKIKEQLGSEVEWWLRKLNGSVRFVENTKSNLKIIDLYVK